jgi:hypothetical protein
VASTLTVDCGSVLSAVDHPAAAASGSHVAYYLNGGHYGIAGGQQEAGPAGAEGRVGGPFCLGRGSVAGRWYPFRQLLYLIL